jgi:hypothetical protein
VNANPTKAAQDSDQPHPNRLRWRGGSPGGRTDPEFCPAL